MPSQPIGIIGLGLLGSAIGQRLSDSRFASCGYDIDADRRDEYSATGRVLCDAKAVFAACERVVLCLPTSDESSVVIQEVGRVLTDRHVIIDTTTGHPNDMAEIGRTLADCNVAYIDATVGGSSSLLRAGDVVIMAGGETSAIDRCRDIFAALARESFHVGPCGFGARMKLAVNLVLGLNRAVLAEGLRFAKTMGLDEHETLAVLKAGPAWSRAMDAKGEKMLTGNFEPQARLAQHLKDVELMLNCGTACGAKQPFSTLHKQLLEQLVEQGFGALDNSAVIKAFDD